MRAYGVQLNCQVSWCTCCIEVVIMIMKGTMEKTEKLCCTPGLEKKV